MKLTNSQLQRIIQEELGTVLQEFDIGPVYTQDVDTEDLPKMFYDPNEPEAVLGWEDEGLEQTVINPQIVGTARPGFSPMIKGERQTVDTYPMPTGGVLTTDPVDIAGVSGVQAPLAPRIRRRDSAISGVPPWITALQGLDPDWDPNEVLEEDKTPLHQVIQEELQKFLEQLTPEQMARRQRAAKSYGAPTDTTIAPAPLAPAVAPAVVQPPDRREYPPHMGLISTLFKDAGPDLGLQYAKKMFPELSELNILYTALVAAPRWKDAVKKSKVSGMP